MPVPFIMSHSCRVNDKAISLLFLREIWLMHGSLHGDGSCFSAFRSAFGEGAAQARCSRGLPGGRFRGAAAAAMPPLRPQGGLRRRRRRRAAPGPRIRLLFRKRRVQKNSRREYPTGGFLMNVQACFSDVQVSFEHLQGIFHPFLVAAFITVRGIYPGTD